jgi:hypothetical protein
VALFARPPDIVPQPLVNDLGEAVQLRPLDRRRPPIPRRSRKAQHLLHAVARNPEMTRRSAFTHAVPTRETDLPIKFHGENTPALPVARKGQSGRVLLRPQRDDHAATVVEFCTADYIPGCQHNHSIRRIREFCYLIGGHLCFQSHRETQGHPTGRVAALELRRSSRAIGNRTDPPEHLRRTLTINRPFLTSGAI